MVIFHSFLYVHQRVGWFWDLNKWMWVKMEDLL